MGWADVKGKNEDRSWIQRHINESFLRTGTHLATLLLPVMSSLSDYFSLTVPLEGHPR